MIEQFSLESKADALTYYSMMTPPTNITNNDILKSYLERTYQIGRELKSFEDYKKLVLEFISVLNDILDTEWEYDEAVVSQLIQLILLKNGYLLFSDELEDPQNEGFKKLFNSTFS